MPTISGVNAGHVVELDGARRLLHLVNRVVHHPDQGRNRTPVERRQEYPAHILQHVPNDVVRLMLFILDGLDMQAAMSGPPRTSFANALASWPRSSCHALRTVRKNCPCFGKQLSETKRT
jgi:hypothetical protein